MKSTLNLITLTLYITALIGFRNITKTSNKTFTLNHKNHKRTVNISNSCRDFSLYINEYKSHKCLLIKSLMKIITPQKFFLSQILNNLNVMRTPQVVGRE